MSEDLNLVVKVAMESQSFQQQINNINRQMKVVQSEFANASSKFSEFGSATERLKTKSASLAQQLELAKQKVTMFKEAQDKAKATLEKNAQANEQLKQKLDSVKSAYEQSVQATGKNSEESKRLKTELDDLNKKYKDNQNTINNNVRTIDNYNIKLNQAEKSVNELTRELKSTERELEVQNSKWTKLSKSMEQIGEKSKAIGRKMKDVGQTLTTGVTLPLLGIATVAAKVGMDFESAFAGVKKTVDGTKEQFQQLEKGIRNMSKQMPTSASDIAHVAEAAGQLGIQTDNILGFTKTIIDLGNATNLVGEEGASELAKFANITSMSQKNFDRLGSTIVALGNNMATTESDIVAMGMRLAGAGHQVGLTEAQIMGLSAALSSVGIEAEAGGSAVSKVMVDMQLATEVGGAGLENFAKVAGMSSSQFQKAFKEDAAGALIAFIKGLSESEKKGVSAIKVLDDMGITEVRMRDALLRAAGAGDLFNKSIQIGTKAWQENTALANEANQRYATTESQLKIVKNQITDAAITIGNNLLPAIRDIAVKVAEVTDKFANLSPASQKFILVITGIVAIIPPLILVIGGLISAFGVISTAVASASAAIAEAGGVIALLTNPIGIAIGAIVGFIAIFTTLYNTNTEFRDNVNSVWQQIQTTISGIIENLKIIFSVFVQVAQQMWQSHGTQIVAIITSAWNLISSIITTAINLIANVIKVATGIISGDWSKTWEGIKGVASTIWNGIGSIITNAIELIKTTMSGGLSIAWDTVKRIFNGIKESIMIPIRAATDFVKEQVDKIKGFFSGLKIELPHIKLPHFSLTGEFSLEKMTVPSIGVNWYDTGGVFTRPSVIGVGEKRPEFVGALEDLRYLIGSELDKRIGNNNKDNEPITIIVPVNLDGQVIAKVIAPYSDKLQGNNLRLVERGGIV